MFGTLSQTMGRAKAAIKRLILKIKALFTITKSSRYEGAPVRVVTRRESLLRLAAAKAVRGDAPNHYPFLSCRTGRAKGKRDRSLKVRSNKRKASARAKAR